MPASRRVGTHGAGRAQGSRAASAARCAARCAGLALAAALLAGPALAANVTGVSPQGEVGELRQLVVRFSEPVVPLGDGRQADPATVQCSGPVPAGSGRWLEPQAWAYEFRSAVPPGVRCTVQLRADWRPPTGVPAPTARPVYTVGTGGPAVLSVWPYDGAVIEEDQHFLLQLNGAAAEASLARGAWCEVDGIGERQPVQVVGGAGRDAVLKARRLSAATAARSLLLRCPRPLPGDTAVRLVWGPGIAAAANPQVLTRTPQRFEFRVRPAFTAEFSCERERAEAACLPIRPLSLRFSSPVPRALAAQARLVPAAGGAALAPVFDRDDRAPELGELRFPVPLPAQARFRLELPPGLQDLSGRPLANAASFPLAVATGDAPPIAKFAAAPFGVLERADPVLPVTLRHVQGDLRPGATKAGVRIKRIDGDAEILAWFQKLQRYDERTLTAQEAGLPRSQWTTVEREQDARGRTVERRVPRTVGTRELSLLEREAGVQRVELPQLAGGDPRPFEVVGIPLPTPGYHVVEIESPRLGAALLAAPAPMYVRTGVLVTNLGVHFKLGRENSLAWVTTLDRGRPVAGAEVAVHDCRGRRLWAGRTAADGAVRIAQALDADAVDCPEERGFFVTARHTPAEGAPDLAFVFSHWQKGIESWRFNQPTASGARADVRVHTVFDRTLLRAGETVSMKHFARLETGAGLAPLPADERPTRARLLHVGSGQETVLPLDWGAGPAGRSALSSWNIPPNARLGAYQVTLEREGAEPRPRGGSWQGGEFRVEAFRVPLVDARLSAPKAAAIAPASLPLSLQLNYTAGGGVAGAALRASALLKPRELRFEGYEAYAFEPPREPREAAAPEDDGDEGAARAGRLVADKLPATTDRQGAATLTLPDLPPLTRASELQAEVSFADPNGEIQTVSTTVPLWPAAVVPGIRASSWVSSRGRVAFTALALDTGGRPLKDQAVTVSGRHTQWLSSRKRLVGGFYGYDSREERRELGTLCQGRTDAHGRLSCEATLDAAGQVELVVEAADAAGRRARAATTVWVTGQGELWFAQDNDDRIDVLPEKPRYEPGETARLQVRMPFREATALVAVEREGVIEHRVVTLRGDDPTLELPIASGWAPNVYVSVLALRGRLREVPWYSFFQWGWREPLAWVRAYRYEGREYRAPTAMVDLARPAFKLGVAALRVGLAAHELQVKVLPARSTAGVREKVPVTLQVTQAGRPVAGAELAFAAVDEGLLALRPNDSWDLLGGLLQPRGWGVETSTAQSEIVGRRHYGRKAVPAGGGGGRGGTRELFDTLLLWAPRVVTDARGEARVEVPLNDALTRFRLVAVADAGWQQFGTGSAGLTVTQDLQILAGLPPLVRDGDRYTALLTLRNTTPRAMTVRATLAGEARRSLGTGPDFARLPLALPPQELTLPAGEARELRWPVTVPPDVFGIGWEAAAEEIGPGGKARDRLKLNQLVAPAVPLRVTQATLQPLEGRVLLPLAAPAGALAGVDGTPLGGVEAGLQPRLGGALPGLRRFFETYPYACLEQRTSKALGLGDRALWAAVAGSLPGYLDADGLASYFPPPPGAGAEGSDRLTAYVVAAAHEAGVELPAAAREAMLGGLAAFVEGRIERRTWSPRPDRDVRKLAALEALSRHGRALPRMLGSIELAPARWPTAALIDWLRILQRVEGIPERARLREEAQQQLRARLSMSGTTLRFSTEDEDQWWWLMDSADANAARLLLAVLDEPGWKDDVPKLVVGALGRQRGGAWSTTTANLWGVLALEKFSARFEAQPVTGLTRLAVLPGGAGPAAPRAASGASAAAAVPAAPGTASVDWARRPQGATQRLPWPAGAGEFSAQHAGGGRPWLTVQTLAAVPLQAPLAAGYRVARSVVPVEQKVAGRWSRGDVLRVRLEVEAQADMSWVVLDDPLPAGAAHLGTGLGRDSALTTRGERREGSAWLAYEERAAEAWRGYWAYLPRGRHVVEYTLRLNNPGRFALPPTRVEAMYAPEVHGELPNAPIEVLP
ncbi:alpha-2-macroglobulin family protein [Piscinibacter sakaiensis]|uniref:Large extracellular alpha-helical protein n=1 Tax=Piscinibacter sakaiensis TaxID=1547922 RepID=A0A0K8P833_PISS1|nr:MG2 domain-containing protein [Piscinibacter sakaiensis]GAP38796.1 large extracellular alpha-helical protein [Piscinibacter sakaiensis]